MKLGFKPITLVKMGTFLFGLLFMFLNTVWNGFFYFSLVFFLAGFVMATISAYKGFILCKKEQKETKIELLMEIATSDIGEQYVIKDSPFSKAEEAMRKRILYNKFINVVLFALLSVLLIFILIKAIF